MLQCLHQWKTFFVTRDVWQCDPSWWNISPSAISDSWWIFSKVIYVQSIFIYFLVPFLLMELQIMKLPLLNVTLVVLHFGLSLVPIGSWTHILELEFSSILLSSLYDHFSSYSRGSYVFVLFNVLWLMMSFLLQFCIHFDYFYKLSFLLWNWYFISNTAFIHYLMNC